jgi:hypothetical protein
MLTLARRTPLFSVIVRRLAALSGLLVSVAAFTAITPLSAIAQAAPAATPSGITVTGYGEASAPAEKGTLQLLLSRGDYYGGPPPQPRPGDVPGAEEKRLAEPVVQALVDKGVAATAVTVVVSPVLGSSVAYGPGGPAVARIDVALDKPELSTLTDLVASASVAAANESLVIGLAGAGYEVADCDALDVAARQAAITDARDRAGRQAKLLGVQLGEVVASSDVPATADATINYFGVSVPQNGCAPPAPSVALNGPGLTVTVPTFDSTTEPEVELYARVSLTFAIKA